MRINDAGLTIIKEFEGLELKAYKDIVGVVTIGYGSTGSHVKMGDTVTVAEAEALLLKDLERFESGVAALLVRPVTPNQFSALVCFAYNVGLANFKSSTLLRCINKGHPRDAAGEFLRWTKAGGVVVKGLVRRREAEKRLYAAGLSSAGT